MKGEPQDDFALMMHNLADPVRLRVMLCGARRIASRQFARDPNWALAMNVFGVGFTYGWRICRLAGIDPDSRQTPLTGAPNAE